MASAFSDDDRNRHSTALMVVLDIFPPIMRDMICNDFTPNTVLTLIHNRPTFQRSLNPMEKKMISDMRNNGYNSLDISVFYKIIRYFGLLTPPNQGWGNRPALEDIDKGDDVERMRYLRNDVFHRPAGGLSESQKNNFFRLSIEIARRMDNTIGCPPIGYASKVEEMRSFSITREKYTQLLEKCVEYQARLQEMAGAPSFDLFYGNDIKIKIDAQGDNLASGGRTIACTLYLRNTDFDVNAVIQTLDVIKEHLRRGNFDMGLEDAASGSLILYVTIHDTCFMTKEILHKTVQSFLHTFFIGASIPFKHDHIYTVVLGESEHLGLDNQENNDLDYLKEDKSPYLKLNVNVNDSAFQNEFTLYREVNSFVAGMYNAEDRHNVPLNGSSREVLMIVDDERAIDYTSRYEAIREPQFRMAQVAVVSEKESNYFKISTLLLRISPRAVRIKFDDVFHPENLTDTLSSNLSKLTDLKNKRYINQTQWNSMFPSTDDPTSKSFDTPLMICLLRNLAGIQIANKLPSSTDFSIGADLSRIKTYRKDIANSKDRTFKNDKFVAIWNETEAAVIRLSSGKLKKNCGTLKTRAYDVLDIKQIRSLIQDSKRLVRIEEINEVADRAEKIDVKQKPDKIQAPKDFDIVECTDHSITVKWIRSESNDCQFYELDYRLKGQKYWKSLTTSTTDGSTNETGCRVYILENLSPETQYEVRMYYVDNQCKSQYTQYKTQQTLKSAPKDFDIVECTDLSITVKWLRGESDDCQFYELDYRLQGQAEWTSLSFSSTDVSTNERGCHMYILQNLSPESYYEVRMCYMNNQCQSQYTEYKTQQTLKTESAIKNTSIALYHYLCQNVVGTEKHVRTFRLMNNVRDNLLSNKSWTCITSGSFGEGLQMRGSDLNVMAVLKQIEVCEDTHIYFNADKIHFTMELEDTQPGFTKLRLVHSNDWGILQDCNDIGNDFYFSNLSFKQKFSTDKFSTVHGPCITDANGICDCTPCLHCKLWITPAQQWVTRSNNSWPRCDVKQAIVKHGVLFVPVGVKGSTQEELEWRISFSVGEKLLIYSFTHTQLLCYALMKIILKDVIAFDVDCKELLCSYFMKTILFWICEELPSSEWKPENLISCYKRCLRRLIYCVEYALCPHYFIPENNLFENKIQGKAQKLLLNRLYILNSYGWHCIFLSDQMSNFNGLTSDGSKETSYSYAKSVERYLNSYIVLIEIVSTNFHFLFEKVINKVLSSESSKIKYMYIFYLSKFCCKSEVYLPFEYMTCNKSTYKKNNTYISTLLLTTRHDAVSGWLRLASVYYKRKQFNKALHLIQYSILTCTPERLHYAKQFSDIHYELFNLNLFLNMTFIQLCKCLLLDFVLTDITVATKLQPDELQIELPHLIPTIVYAQFLRFLCHYHLKNIRQCWVSLRDLKMIIENNLIANPILKGLSYSILGISFQLLGNIESARQAFMQSIKLFPDQKSNTALKKLSLISQM